MIMITGGSFQGKTDFAKSHFPDRERIVHFEEEILKCIRENKDPQKIYRTCDRAAPPCGCSDG